MKLYEAIAQNSRLLTIDHFADSANERLSRIVALLPSGSGFDAGTKLESADDSRIVFSTSFHHMDENGFYDGWTEHKVTARASLTGGLRIHVSGRNRNNIKDYIADVFHVMLSESFDWIAK